MTQAAKPAAGKSQVTTLDDEPAGKSAAAPVSADAEVLIRHHADLSGVRKILTIHADSAEGGNLAVFIGLNGVGYQVPRGKPWNVPEELVHNLDNATQTLWENQDGKNIAREAPRFAYTVRDFTAAAA